MRRFEHYYKVPFECDDYSSRIVWSEDFERAFDFDVKDKSIHYKVVDILNGVSSNKLKIELRHEDGIIYCSGMKFISIRGWGNLTGIGGHNLKEDKAEKIQDEFGKWIIEKLTS